MHKKCGDNEAVGNSEEALETIADASIFLLTRLLWETSRGAVNLFERASCAA